MRNIFFYLLLCIFAFYSCDKDNSETIEPIKSEYNLEKGEEGSFQREIFDFYNTYGSVILTKADSSDFRYNFEFINEVKITNSDNNENDLKNALSFFKEIFVNTYGDEFCKKNIPFNIIFCNEIIAKVKEGWSTKEKSVPFWVANNFIAIAGVNDNINNLTDEDKLSIKKSLHIDFWVKYMFDYSEKFLLDYEFYGVSEAYYTKSRAMFQEPAFTNEECWEFGFTGKKSWGYNNYTKREDAIEFLKLVLTTNEIDLQDKFSKYPRYKKKYYVVKNVFKDIFNIDTNNLFN